MSESQIVIGWGILFTLVIVVGYVAGGLLMAFISRINPEQKEDNDPPEIKYLHREYSGGDSGESK